MGNVLAINYPLTTINYGYDALNQLTNLVDALGTHAFSYTPGGRLASENGPWANDTVSYGYAQGLRTALAIHTNTVAYAYDAAWRMTNLTSSLASGFIYQFVGAGSQVQKIFLPNGAYITNRFDPLAQLKETALVNHWGHTLDGYTYSVDALGQRTNVLRDLGLTRSSVNVGYDNIQQITSWNASETNGLPRFNEQLGWAYDAANNLLRRTNNLLVQTFSNDAANQLSGITRTGTFTEIGATPAPMTSVTVNGNTAQTYGDFTFARTNLTLANGVNIFTNIAQNNYSVKATNVVTLNWLTNTPLAYDANGNLTNDGTKTFGWDVENQLTNVQVAGAWKSEFVYDGLNRRRIARDYSWNGSTWVKTNETRLIYDGYQIIQERDTNNGVLVTYTRGFDMSGTLDEAGGIGGLLARSDASGSAYYHNDGSGNITALMDGYENMVARYQYGAFGKIIGQWGKLAAANTMRFSSMPDVRGMTGYPFRWYLSESQRFANIDLMQQAGGINLYGFVGNNPLNRIDPLGLYGNPVSGPNGPVGPSSRYDPSIEYPSGQDFTPRIKYPPGTTRTIPSDPPSWSNTQDPYAPDPEEYDHNLPSDFQQGAGGIDTDDDVFGTLLPFLPKIPKLGNCSSVAPKLKGAPKRSPNYRPPTNKPQMPPENIPPGYRIRSTPPTDPPYPNEPFGNWKLEKEYAPGKWQPVNPTTGSPGRRWDTHVPYSSEPPPGTY